MTRNLPYRLVDSVFDALRVRRLRNACCGCFTNHRQRIGVLQQIVWYFRWYQRMRRTGSYRVFLFFNEQRAAVGYGALSWRDGQLDVTECVAPESRGQGYGRAILSALIALAHAEGRPLRAEIWGSNKPSIALHEKLGFSLQTVSVKDGQELHTYSLKPPSASIKGVA